MKAAIVLDTWKVSIFCKYLTASYYNYTIEEGPTPDVSAIRVEYSDLDELKALGEVCAEATKECLGMKYERS